MSASKNLWMDEVERVVEQYSLDAMTREEAMQMLMWLGFFPSEAADMLDGAIA